MGRGLGHVSQAGKRLLRAAHHAPWLRCRQSPGLRPGSLLRLARTRAGRRSRRRRPGRHALVTAALALLLAAGAGGCRHDSAAPTPEPPPAATRPPAYDGSLPPAQAALALVPAAATTLRVTDYDRVKAELGVPDLSSASPPGDIATFWRRTSQVAVLTPGLLRPVDDRLETGYGFGQADVAWEAVFAGPSGDGWVLRMKGNVPMAAVRRAVRARGGPLAGVEVDAAHHLVTRGAAGPGEPNWAARPGLADLVGTLGLSTYAERGCRRGDSGGQRLQPLTAYAVEYAGTLATARLGPDRDDLFARMRLGRSQREFSQVYTRGAADPSTGRIGYEMTDPPAAARLALHHRLPFAVCEE
ncbi:hypothetical protein [Nocardioides sp. KR10-350]|uniref:hypothetical protein n=1 Tax=Nocardioides cheoyonin TaxID=3156615 RepID=UPI0032B3761C